MSDPHAAQHHVKYWLIFFFLCIFTAISWLADEAKSHHIMRSVLLIVVLVLAVATAKALFVMMYFMHLKFEGRWKFLLLSPTIILAIGLPLALLPDVGVHYYTTDVPQNSAKVTPAPPEEGRTAEPSEP